ncbi:MAG: endopeptidase La [Myxococcota bacterium]
MSQSFPKPANPVPLLPLRNGVLFPGTVITLPVGRPRSVALLESLQQGDVIAVGVQRDPKTSDPTIADLFEVGTYGRVHRIVKVSPKHYQLVLEGGPRLRLDNLAGVDPFWRAEVTELEEQHADDPEAAIRAEALVDGIAEEIEGFGEAVKQHLKRPRENPSLVADVIAAGLSLPSEREIEVLILTDVIQRLKRVSELIGEARTLAEMKSKVDREVRSELNKQQREAILRSQLKAIKKELGEGEEGDESDKLRSKLEDADLPEEPRQVVDRELSRLESINPAQAEYGVIRNYLELIASLPWSKRAETKNDLDAVEQKLDEDHFGLSKVKKRILEHLAVRKMTGNNKGAILCFVGPPGVGKTSLGQSIADATGRPFVRVALGGVRDEAEIRGHRRTYVGALPGRILHALRKVEVKNPVLLLDEVDKLGQGWMGSPEAALLEVLDPEQNHTFQDHYLELPFDLSEVFFLCTANTLETLSAPLRDRLEIVELQGYTMEEKLEIAKAHLVPKRLEDHGLHEGALTIDDEALREVIRSYTREAGVRQLNREVTRLCRAVTLEIARTNPDEKAPAQTLSVDDVRTHLGKPKFFNDVAERTMIPGVATGLAWTPVGGDILFVEASKMPGKGRFEFTGQLGDVMKESARAALTYIRANAGTLDLDPDFLETTDLHVHIPAGAVPKDGPSAGVTMFTALTSLLTGRKVRSDTAMTGEATLRGRVLPVGGIKSKVLAAHRAGIERVILPKKNERDLDDVPVEIQDRMTFVFAEDMSEVLAAALEKDPTPVVGRSGGDGQDTIRQTPLV